MLLLGTPVDSKIRPRCSPSPPNRLVDILRGGPAAQMCYQVGFCFWLLSFEQEIAEQINKFVHSLACIGMHGHT